MTDQILNTLTYQIGDRFTKTSYAEITAVEYDRDFKGKNPPVIGYRMAITEPDKTHRPDALVRVSDLPGFMMHWTVNASDAVGAQHAAPSESPVDTDLTATAALIKDLRAQLVTLSWQVDEQKRWIAELENDLEAVTESRDSAIADAFAADQHNAELTERLAEACAKSAPAIAVPSADVLTAPKQEIKVFRDMTEDHFAEMLNEDWTPLHIQFIRPAEEYRDYEDRLDVVWMRREPIPAPQSSTRKTVTAVGPHVIVQPVEPSARPTTRAQQDLVEVLDEGRRVYENALANAPISIRPLLPHPVGS